MNEDIPLQTREVNVEFFELNSSTDCFTALTQIVLSNICNSRHSRNFINIIFFFLGGGGGGVGSGWSGVAKVSCILVTRAFN